MINTVLNIFSGAQLNATIFLAIVGLLFIVALVFFILSIRAQKVYDTETLPMLPGMEDEEVEEIVEETGTSAFHIDQDDELHSMGDKEAQDLFKEMRAASPSDSKKKKTGMFGKKS